MVKGRGQKAEGRRQKVELGIGNWELEMYLTDARNGIILWTIEKLCAYK
ncbi:MAG: hypothetical protein F6J86_23340 [Symploca sp. SIO1B1]|nr:hypothetical protein [Symploca sp. SIO1B1]